VAKSATEIYAQLSGSQLSADLSGVLAVQSNLCPFHA